MPELKTNPNTKHLGITLDTSVFWKPHICKILNFGLYVTSRDMQFADSVIDTIAYFVLFEEQIRFAVWRGAGNIHVEGVLLQQKRLLVA